MVPACARIEDAIALLRAVPIENLRSALWLEHELLPALGLNSEGRFPQHLTQYQGRGVQAWQWPNQLAGYLAFLSQKRIDSYLELGLFNGGTFIVTIEYLSRFNPDIVALGVDALVRPQVRTYLESGRTNAQVIEARTDAPEVSRAVSERLWGLALVDAGHGEAECWSDFQLVRDHARYVAFHDISNDFFPGVGAVWQRISECVPRRTTWEFVDQYPELLLKAGKKDYGLGIVQLFAD